MPKSPKTKKDVSVNIGGDAYKSNIIVGDHNTINVEAIKTVSSLFTIPPPVSDFIGRARELETLKASFQRGALITGLSGAGGIGKTELARKLAHDLADAYPAARLEINLLGASAKPLTSEEAMRRLLEPFYPGQKLPDQPEELRGLYRQTFAQRPSLLLLDNAADAVQVRPLIPPPPSAAIVTSRRHFSLSEFGLSEPLRLDALPPAEARDLLRAASPKLRSAPADEVDRLAALCGRLPLALRVAAALLNDRPDWTPATLLQRLADERTRLQRLKRDSDPDLDVEAAISLSYALLTDDLKARFRALGVFPAPFFKSSAQAVWELPDETEADDLLGKLITRSLVNVLSSGGDGAGGGGASPSPFGGGAGGGGSTYALHDLTRLFALARLEEDPAAAARAMPNTSWHWQARRMTSTRKAASTSRPRWRPSASSSPT
ncbi:MAG: hypothetical protein Fur0016_23930 [Anaerolineales bacterium]